MPGQVTDHWADKPDDDGYPAAAHYLSLMIPAATAQRLGGEERGGEGVVRAMVPTASTQKVQPGAICPTNQAKFIPKNPVRKVSGRKRVAKTVSRVIRRFSRFDTVER